jgi:hypothetical protein
MDESASPNGRWTLRAYDSGGLATTPESVSAELVDNTGRRAKREIFSLSDFNKALWTKDGNHLLIRWKSNAIVAIGGHDVSVVNGY